MMIDLPKRAVEYPVEVADGIRLVMEPLTDVQYYTVNETAELTREEGSDVTIKIRISRLPGLFEDRLRRVEGELSIAGAPFDSANPEHVAAIPQPWRVVALTQLARYAMGLTAADVGNSKGQAGPSPEAETPSPA